MKRLFALAVVVPLLAGCGTTAVVFGDNRAPIEGPRTKAVTNTTVVRQDRHATNVRVDIRKGYAARDRVALDRLIGATSGAKPENAP